MPNEELLKQVQPFFDTKEPGLGTLAVALLDRLKSRRNPIEQSINPASNRNITVRQVKSILLQLGPKAIQDIIDQSYSGSSVTGYPGVYMLKLVNDDDTDISPAQVQTLADVFADRRRLTELLGRKAIGKRTYQAARLWGRYWLKELDEDAGEPEFVDEDEDDDLEPEFVQDEDEEDVEETQDEDDFGVPEDNAKSNNLTKICYIGYSVNPKGRLSVHQKGNSAVPFLIVVGKEIRCLMHLILFLAPKIIHTSLKVIGVQTWWSFHGMHLEGKVAEPVIAEFASLAGGSYAWDGGLNISVRLSRLI
jgi:hypothetical protein